MANLTVQDTPVHDSYSMIDQEKIESFAERLIRKQLLLQFVKPGHPVLTTEERLVQEADNSLREDIKSLHVSGQNVQLVEMVVFIRVRNAVRVIIRFHDIDADIEELAILGAMREALARIARSRIRKEQPIRVGYRTL
jgi:hypothetical protein